MPAPGPLAALVAVELLLAALALELPLDDEPLLPHAASPSTSALDASSAPTRRAIARLDRLSDLGRLLM
ncbi:MAG TPA: hypothetical protein VK707_03190 [Solirubrobacteraceae bacterium]|nr:hypothetical protein [Solirubrobacteraceae bacterium]